MSEFRAFAELLRLRIEEKETTSAWLAGQIGADKAQVSRWINARQPISLSYKQQIIAELDLLHDPRLEAVKNPETWNPWWKLEVVKSVFKSHSSPERDAIIKNYLRGAQPSLQIVREGMVPRTDEVEKLLTSIETGNAITVLNAPIGEGVTSTLLQFLEVLTRTKQDTTVYWSPNGRLPSAPPPQHDRVVVVADRQYESSNFPKWCREIDISDPKKLRVVVGCREKDRRWVEKKLQTEVHAIPLARTQPEDATDYVTLIKRFEAFDDPDVDLEFLFFEEIKAASGFGLLPAMIAATRGEALYLRYRRLVEAYEPDSYEFHTMASAVWLFDINDRIAHGRLPKRGELAAHLRHHVNVLGIADGNCEFEVEKFFGRMLGEISQVGMGCYEFRHPRIAKLLFREVFGTSENKSRPQGTFRASKWAHYASFAEVGPHKQMSPNPPQLSALAGNMVYLIGYDRANKISHESPKAIEDVVRYTITQLFAGDGNDVKPDYYRYLSRGLAQLSKHYKADDPKSVKLIDDTVTLIQASIDEDKSPKSMVYHANTLRGLPAKTRVTLDGEKLSWFDLCDEARKSAAPEDLENVSIETLRVRLRGTPKSGPNAWQHYPIMAFEELADNCARANFPLSKRFLSDRLELLCNLSSWACSGFVGSDGSRVVVPDGDYDDQDLRTTRGVLYQLWQEVARVCDVETNSKGAPPTSLKSHMEGVYLRWLRIEQNNPSKHLTTLQQEALIAALTDQDFKGLADALPDKS